MPVVLGLFGSRAMMVEDGVPGSAALGLEAKAGVVCPSCWGTESWRVGGLYSRLKLVWKTFEYT